MNKLVFSAALIAAFTTPPSHLAAEENLLVHGWFEEDDSPREVINYLTLEAGADLNLFNADTRLTLDESIRYSASKNGTGEIFVRDNWPLSFYARISGKPRIVAETFHRGSPVARCELAYPENLGVVELDIARTSESSRSTAMAIASGNNAVGTCDSDLLAEGVQTRPIDLAAGDVVLFSALEESGQFSGAWVPFYAGTVRTATEKVPTGAQCSGQDCGKNSPMIEERSAQSKKIAGKHDIHKLKDKNKKKKKKKKTKPLKQRPSPRKKTA